MKSLFSLLLALFLLSCQSAEYVKVEERPGLQVLNRKDGTGFLILADTVYTACLGGNRVLAYSEEQAWGTDQMMPKILDYYEKTLPQLQRDRGVAQVPEGPEIEPLISTHWGQGEPYNRACPQIGVQPAQAGCVPVAIGQLLRYHGANTEIPDSTLIAQIGRACRARYTRKSTNVNTLLIKQALVEDFHCAASCRLTTGLSSEELREVCLRDLQEGKPLLLSNGDHAFLCDGVHQDYLHFNMGWYGAYDGYYRLLHAQVNWEFPLATTVVFGIEPAGERTEPREILVGRQHLEELLGTDALKVSSLSISGTLNEQDLILLRRMSGASGNRTETIGILEELNVVGATLPKGHSWKNVLSHCENLRRVLLP